MRALSLAGLCLLAACATGSEGRSPRGADLSGFRTTRVEVSGHAFEVWLAESPAQRAQGLMHATPAQLEPLPDGTPRGMLFVFPGPSAVNFTMRDTFVALDLAHFRDDGLLVEVHALEPLDETPVASGQPVRYALEVLSGNLALRGLGVGAALALPVP